MASTPDTHPPLLFNAGKINFIIGRSLDNFFTEVDTSLTTLTAASSNNALNLPGQGLMAQ